LFVYLFYILKREALFPLFFLFSLFHMRITIEKRIITIYYNRNNPLFSCYSSVTKKLKDMLTVNYCKKNKLSLEHILTDEDKKALLEENKSGNFSYLCLMKEMFNYRNTTVESLLRGWGGVTLVRV